MSSYYADRNVNTNEVRIEEFELHESVDVTELMSRVRNRKYLEQLLNELVGFGLTLESSIDQLTEFYDPQRHNETGVSGDSLASILVIGIRRKRGIPLGDIGKPNTSEGLPDEIRAKLGRSMLRGPAPTIYPSPANTSKEVPDA